jgi:hypothetical protein
MNPNKNLACNDPGMVGSYCSTSDTRRVTLVKKSVISHE